MLQDKIEKASRDAQRRTLFALLCLAGLALTVAAFLAGAGFFWADTRNETEVPVQVREDSTRVSVTPAPGAEPADRAAADRPAPPPQPAPEVDEAARDNFKAELASFQEEIEPRVTQPAFGVWNAQAQQQILDGKENAVGLFASGRYSDATTMLQQAREEAEQEIAARDAAFAQALDSAKSAYEADDADSASLHIAMALSLKPDDADAKTLAVGIEQLPEVLAAMSRARVARTENNLEAEARHLEEVMGLDPSRSEYAARLEEVRGTLRERRYAAHIEAGFASLEAGKLKSARESLDAARAIFPDRGETKTLANSLARAGRESDFRRHLAAAEKARAADDWATAEQAYARAGAIEPNDAHVNGGYALAGRIIAVNKDISTLLTAPERLSSESVAAQAHATLSQARDLSGMSPGLASRARALRDLVDTYDTRVAVRILSDGQTRIAVRGVGQVGTTTDRTIELRPGRYTFEGTRAGFRSKLLRVNIPPGTDSLVVEIYPDERI